jgi:hypothetical protein
MARNFDTFSKEELVGIIRGYEEGPYAQGYLVVKEKIEEILQDFKASRIDTKGTEDKQFANFLAFTKILNDLYDNLDKLKVKIDPTILEEIRKEGLKPKYGTPEYWIKHPKTDAGK